MSFLVLDLILCTVLGPLERIVAVKDCEHDKNTSIRHENTGNFIYESNRGLERGEKIVKIAPLKVEAFCVYS